ncbi:MAG TPA: ferrous iron transport protein B [Capillibacterium sp.]
MHTIALVGNPNCGKTTIFNALTGANQRVGNWPGVTVEKKEGYCTYNQTTLKIVDLPGTYSLGAYSEDELIARDYILKNRPDAVINVVSATNLERNLYLTTQLLEMGIKVVVALNMFDEAEKQKIRFDLKALSDRLGVPVVPTVAAARKGLSALLQETMNLIGRKKVPTLRLSYGEEIDGKIDVLAKLLRTEEWEYPPRWLALKLVEGDLFLLKLVQNSTLPATHPLRQALQDLQAGQERYTLAIVNKRYELIEELTAGAILRPEQAPVTISDRLDQVLMHKWWGLPILAGIMLLVFQLTFKVGGDLLGGFIAGFLDTLGQKVEILLVKADSPAWLISFVTEGIFGGVGAVVEFIPLIVVLYLLMGLLEDSGYMARVAYLMDNIMRAIGLQGKTFISMFVGFGCNVPGIMAARTLDQEKERMIATLINPFMSCGARLPIYLLFIAAFFPKHGGLVLFSLYALGVLVALLMAKVFSKTLFPVETAQFIIELPPYRWPTLRNVMRNMWDNVSGFLQRAGTTIFMVITILWLLAVLPYGVEPYSEQSILGRIGLFLAPLFRPAGFGFWQAAVGLFAGIAAKEGVVATLGMVYAGTEEGLALVSAIQQAFTPLTAVSFLVMTLLYTPCAATLGTIKKETHSLKWTVFAAVYPFALGWLSAVLIYQVGRLCGL